jgi:nucleotide-binding universal stress UspA family protein
MYHRILVPTDGSELSRKAVHSAIELAARLGGELMALYVAHRHPVLTHAKVPVLVLR